MPYTFRALRVILLWLCSTAVVVSDGSAFGIPPGRNQIPLPDVPAFFIQDSSITESMLNFGNSPTDEYCFTYEIGTGGFEWQVCDTAPAADSILESMLKAVNAPTDEYFLTYESTTGDFEWQSSSSASTYASFTYSPAWGTISGATASACSWEEAATGVACDGAVSVNARLARIYVPDGKSFTAQSLHVVYFGTGTLSTSIGCRFGLAYGTDDNANFTITGWLDGQYVDFGGDYPAHDTFQEPASLLYTANNVVTENSDGAWVSVRMLDSDLATTGDTCTNAISGDFQVTILYIIN